MIPDYLDYTDDNILYVQEVVTLQKFFLIYLHQKNKDYTINNYCDTLGWISFIYRAK